MNPASLLHWSRGWRIMIWKLGIVRADVWMSSHRLFCSFGFYSVYFSKFFFFLLCVSCFFPHILWFPAFVSPASWWTSLVFDKSVCSPSLFILLVYQDTQMLTLVTPSGVPNYAVCVVSFWFFKSFFQCSWTQTLFFILFFYFFLPFFFFFVFLP